MHHKVWTQSGVLLAILALLAGCSQPLTTREKGVLAGGGIGAATGAIIGSAVGNPGAGAAIGGALGGAAGGLIGDQLQQRDQVATGQQQVIERQRQELAGNRELLEGLKRQNLEARETDRGVVVNLPDVLFEFGRAELTSEARVKARGIAEVLDGSASDRRVDVEGHADSIGSAAFNQELSERRAENVVVALENSGVSNGRITARGYGKRYPVAPNTNPDGTDNPAGRAKNRRVEVVIQN